MHWTDPKKSPKISIIGGAIILTLLGIVLSTVVNVFKVFQYSSLIFLVGFAPAFWLRNVFQIRNFFSWIVNACIFGILLVPIISLLFGWLHLNIVFSQSVLFFYLLSFVGIGFLLLTSEKNNLADLLHFHGIKTIDFIFIFLIVVFVFILTLQSFSQVFVRYDTFTFWGLDAKYLFLHNRLHGSETDIFGNTLYTSYAPIYYALFYDFMGAVTEQYASWVSIFLHLIALLVLYDRLWDKNPTQKIILVMVMLAISHVVDETLYMFSVYADVLSAFNLLIFTIVLTSPFQKKQYYQRVIFLGLVAVSFFFIKTSFFMFSIALGLIWLAYDAVFLYQNRKSLSKDWKNYFSLIFVCAMVFLRWNYFDQFNMQSDIGEINREIIVPVRVPLRSWALYIKDLTGWLFKKSTIGSVLWVFSMASIIPLIVKRKIKKNFLLIYLLTAAGFLMFVLGYIVKQRSLQSGSLVRYTGMVFYLIPLLFSENVFSTKKKSFLVIGNIATFIVIGIVFVLNIRKAVPVWPYELGPSSYRGYLQKYESIANTVVETAGGDARVVIADDRGQSKTFDDNVIESIFIRYYLINNSVGGDFTMPMHELLNFADEKKANYVLLISYANTIDGCGEILKENHNYLIRIGDCTKIEQQRCQVAGCSILDLGEN